VQPHGKKSQKYTSHDICSDTQKSKFFAPQLPKYQKSFLFLRKNLPFEKKLPDKKYMILCCKRKLVWYEK